MNAAFCTLCEGDYHLGAAALLNSLIACGFRGTFIIGWRGAPPPWTADMEMMQGSDDVYVIEGVHVVLREMRIPWLLAHIKPRLMLDVLQHVVPEADAVFYADPDIVVEAPWSFFESWVKRGIAVCEDCCFAGMSKHHYLRKCWQEFAEARLGLAVDCSIESCYNSGFVGLMRSDASLLETWHKALLRMDEAGVPLTGLKPGVRFDAFFGTDQDALNIAAMAHSGRLCSLGTEGMGFSEGMVAMWHAVEPPKPWRRAFVWDLLVTGRGVPQAHRKFLAHAAGPVKAWSAARLALKRLDCKVAVVLGRVYHSA